MENNPRTGGSLGGMVTRRCPWVWTGAQDLRDKEKNSGCATSHLSRGRAKDEGIQSKSLDGWVSRSGANGASWKAACQ